jgi:short subunit fatty acids transporter
VQQQASHDEDEVVGVEIRDCDHRILTGELVTNPSDREQDDQNRLAAVGRAVPATAGVLIQFPLYGAIAMIITQAKNGAGVTVSDQIAHAFVSVSTQHMYPLLIGIYSAILGFFIPSGGGKWLLEAPYVKSESASRLGSADL